MLALTVIQPWAWAIIHAGKDVENRNWQTKHRGPLLIHAGLKWDEDGVEFIRAHGVELPERFEFGGLVGRVELVAIERGSESPWAMEARFHWRLAEPRALPFEPLAGRPGLFHVRSHDPQQSLGV